MTTQEETIKKKKHKKGKKSKVISFDEEVVTKDAADKILASAKANERNSKEDKKKEKKRKKKQKNNEDTNSIGEKVDTKTDDISSVETMEVDGEGPPKKKKKRNQLQPISADVEGEGSTTTPSDKKGESIRSMKRKKYAKLLEEKKLQTELQLQQKALNYLSKWKHSRSEWKFEKLRQIWLQTNMFDDAKVPDDFWQTLVEYLSNSKGQSRDILLKEAQKIIDQDESKGETVEITVKTQRARDIIQSLQE